MANSAGMLCHLRV